MTATRRQRRALGGKRALRRRAHDVVSKIIELSREGISTKAIASSLGLGEDFIHLVLEHARKVEVQGQGGDSYHPPPLIPAEGNAIELESGGDS